MYIRGDLIPGVGVVDGNRNEHPWPMDDHGGVFYGTVQVGNYFYDAQTGAVLSPTEVKMRRNQILYDYEQKWENAQEWRERNSERILRGEINDTYREKWGWIKKLIYIFLKWKKERISK